MALSEAPTDHAAALRELAYEELAQAMPSANLVDAQSCSRRLQAALPEPDQLERNLVLVAFGGGKDSAYMLAFVRAMQLILFRELGRTFRMRVATNRHAGMPQPVMDNIHREYVALRLYDDPDCELILIDGNEVSPFAVDLPQRPAVIERNRLDILMTGHRTFADGRPTFCNACNFSVANSFGLAASYDGGADIFVTGDSSREQRQYTLWVGRLARRLTPQLSPSGAGIGKILSRLDGIAQTYFTEIHGADATAELAERRVSSNTPPALRFFSIYTDTEYASWDHMDFLTGFLGFEFDDVAFSFTESDCGNPALMAHLRALKQEHAHERSYAEGLAEYVDFAVNLMRSKDFPPELMTQMAARYAGPEAGQRMRDAAAQYAWDTFRLTEEQLVCMTYSPFAGKGDGLERFLTREYPELVDRLPSIHLLLSDELSDEVAPVAELERISGLSVAQLRTLYRLTGPGLGGREVIDIVLEGDPHKAVISTHHRAGGPAVLEQISGR